MAVLTVSILDIMLDELSDNKSKEFVDLIRRFNIVEIEPELSEDISFTTEGKYYFLSVLRDVFIKFREFGDTELIVTRGGCHQNCYSNCPTAYQFMGNHSKETFAFVMDETKWDIKEIHFCVGFVDDKGVKGDNYYQFMFWAAAKLKDMRKNKAE